VCSSDLTTPVTKGGVAPADLGDYDVAYVAGSKPFTLTAEERDALKKFLAGGGFLWAEQVGGIEWAERAAPPEQIQQFDEALLQAAKEMGLAMRALPPSHPIMTGKMDGAAGYDLTQGLNFRRALKIKRAAAASALLVGIFDGDRLVGVYSPFDVLFSLNDYEAYGCKGYRPVDAEAVATNIVVYLSTQAGPKTSGAKEPAAKEETPAAKEKEPAAKEKAE
jgi:hypothetical protein